MITIIILLCIIIFILLILLFKKNNIVIHNEDDVKRGMELERKRRELKEYLAAKYPYSIPPELELREFDNLKL